MYWSIAKSSLGQFAKLFELFEFKGSFCDSEFLRNSKESFKKQIVNDKFNLIFYDNEIIFSVNIKAQVQFISCECVISADISPGIGEIKRFYRSPLVIQQKKR